MNYGPPPGAPPGPFGPPPPGNVGPPPGGYGPPGGFDPSGGMPPNFGYGPMGPRNSGLAVGALCTGIGSLLLSCCYCISPIVAIVGLVLGFVALGNMKRDPSLQGRGLAIAGIVCSGVSLGLTVLLFLLGIGNQILQSSGYGK